MKKGDFFFRIRDNETTYNDFNKLLELKADEDIELFSGTLDCSDTPKEVYENDIIKGKAILKGITYEDLEGIVFYNFPRCGFYVRCEKFTIPLANFTLFKVLGQTEIKKYNKETKWKIKFEISH